MKRWDGPWRLNRETGRWYRPYLAPWPGTIHTSSNVNPAVTYNSIGPTVTTVSSSRGLQIRRWHEGPKVK